MRKEFLVDRQGKQFVLFAGLLDMAHTQGLRSIHTQMLQAPCAANDFMAICAATVVMADAEGVVRTFQGIGDAAPNNVAKPMVTCLLRFSETRAKGRALRDALNIGTCSFEELGQDDSGDVNAAAEREYQARAPRPGSGRQATRSSEPSGPCPECRTSGKFHKPGCSKAPVAA